MVRTRYAPSPTGVPHVGNLRTALFDYLLARHHGGQFVLRIEDTDQTRYAPDAVEGLLESLRWLGIEPDEGPGDRRGLRPVRAVGTPRAATTPPRDGWSTRATLMSAGARRSVSTRCAPSRCACKQPPRYDRRCRDDAGRAAARTRGGGRGARPRRPFRTPLRGAITVHDAIHGDSTFDLATIDDFVMLKSDGFPTYHLAYIVDDEAMKITHVLRGDEWIPSAPRHMLIYRALGIEPPVIAHLPRVLGPDGAKLSKRHGATSVFEYADQGYLPDAMFNFLGLLGWSLDDKTDVISRDQFIANFTLDRVVKNPAVFNVEKLTWMNGVYIREMPEDRLVEMFAERLERDLPVKVARPIDRALVAGIAPLIRERIKVLSEVVDYCDFFFVDELHYGRDDLLGKAWAARAADARAALEAATSRVEALPSWAHDALEQLLRALAEELGVKAGDLFSLIRVAVTGRKVSPPLFETMEVLGKERSLTRLSTALRCCDRRFSGHARTPIRAVSVEGLETPVLNFDANWGFV